jgi:3-hydroxyisobutyrate dehydrogenase-like beta-hydroxyacid dehydrogenase
LQYETEVKNGKLLLVVHGSPEEVERAKDLLDQSHANSTAVHVERVTVDA